MHMGKNEQSQPVTKTQIELYRGPNLEVMPESIPNESVDCVVTDPPYGLSKEPDIAEVLTHWLAGEDYVHQGGGFMGKTWDSFVPGPSVWRECFRVLKPGGWMAVFAGTRTVDLMMIAIRLAGFEIRDTVDWIYGSGFPKSRDVGKAIDQAAGATREVVNRRQSPRRPGTVELEKWRYRDGVVEDTAPATEEAQKWDGWGTQLKPAHEPIILCRKPLERGLSVDANVLRHGTGAINIEGSRVGTADTRSTASMTAMGQSGDARNWNSHNNREVVAGSPSGRWPANVLLTHSPGCVRVGERRVKRGADGWNGLGRMESWRQMEGRADRPDAPEVGYADNDGKETVEAWDCVEGCPVAVMDEQSEGQRASKPSATGTGWSGSGAFPIANDEPMRYEDPQGGGASRFYNTFSWDSEKDLPWVNFYYAAKAGKAERNEGLDGLVEGQTKGGGGTNNTEDDVCGKYGSIKAVQRNIHPTVKPIAVMRWLIRLLCPPGGTCLDLFMGSGTTGRAGKLEGIGKFIGIDLDQDGETGEPAGYMEIAAGRIGAPVTAKHMPVRKEVGTGEVKAVPVEAVTKDRRGRIMEGVRQLDMFGDMTQPVTHPEPGAVDYGAPDPVIVK
jgi:DNA modification methylase